MSDVETSPLTTEEARLTSAALQLSRYSQHIGEVIERVTGPGSGGNYEVQILTHLALGGASRPSDMVRATGLGRTNVARLVDRLEEQGLVRRSQGADDRRAVFTDLTPRGRRWVVDLDRALQVHYEATTDVARDIIELLGGDPARPPAQESLPALLVAQRAAVAGAPLVQHFAADLGPLARRKRMVLCLLASQGPARPGEIGDVVGLTTGGMTNLLDHLEDDGFIERQYGTVAGDRRAVVVRLTPAGLSVVRRMAVILEQHREELCEALALATNPVYAPIPFASHPTGSSGRSPS